MRGKLNASTQEPQFYVISLKEHVQMSRLWLVEYDNHEMQPTFWFNTAMQLIITGVDMKRDVFPTNYMAKG